MLGILRFALALCVAFSHMGLTPNFHFGAMSVMTFYLIAGYVMTFSFRHNFGNSLSNAKRFYIDRFFRVYPLYFLSLVFILVFTAFTHYGVLYLDAKSTFINLTVFGLNDYGFNMNGAVWSLGSESQFYLLLPLLVVFPRLKYALLVPSYAIFVAASFGHLEAVRWGYKLLPGTLFLFILGSVLFDMRTDETWQSKGIVGGMLALAVVHLSILSFTPALIEAPYAFEVLTGLIGGTVWIYALADVKPAHRWLDTWLGKLSYPLFVSHATVLYAFDHLRLTGTWAPSHRGLVALQVITAVVVSIPFAMVDDRVQAYRKRIQESKAMAPVNDPTTPPALA